MAVSAPSQQRGIDSGALPETVKQDKGVALSSAVDVSNANLGSLSPPAVFDGKIREVGGRDITT